ncbi:hypothetical protein IV203_016060 [Nitzschia inconspicua]|uniref:Uncharacterized protein n=1 Tax=Nitzschia inconspicua TaxID=303405 RepID=A0A9K3KQK5_9STRA|nr:hypothetical protein IV203_016060 [Nitzschia inconspicua]
MDPPPTVVIEMPSPRASRRGMYHHQQQGFQEWNRDAGRPFAERSAVQRIPSSQSVRTSKSTQLLAAAARRQKLRSEYGRVSELERYVPPQQTYREYGDRATSYYSHPPHQQPYDSPYQQQVQPTSCSSWTHHHDYHAPRDYMPARERRMKYFPHGQDPPGRIISTSGLNGCDERNSVTVTRVNAMSKFRPSVTKSPPLISSVLHHEQTPSRVAMAQKRLLHLELRKIARRCHISSVFSSSESSQMLQPSMVKPPKFALFPVSSNSDARSTTEQPITATTFTTDDLLERAREVIEATRSILSQLQEQVVVGQNLDDASVGATNVAKRNASDPLTSDDSTTCCRSTAESAPMVISPRSFQDTRERSSPLVQNVESSAISCDTKTHESPQDVSGLSDNTKIIEKHQDNAVSLTTLERSIHVDDLTKDLSFPTTHNMEDDPSTDQSSVHCSDGVSSDIFSLTPSSTNVLKRFSLFSFAGGAEKVRRGRGIKSNAAFSRMDQPSTTASKTSGSSVHCDAGAAAPRTRSNRKEKDGVAFVIHSTSLLFCRRDKLEQNDWLAAKHLDQQPLEGGTTHEANVMEMVFFD